MKGKNDFKKWNQKNIKRGQSIKVVSIWVSVKWLLVPLKNHQRKTPRSVVLWLLCSLFMCRTLSSSQRCVYILKVSVWGNRLQLWLAFLFLSFFRSCNQLIPFLFPVSVCPRVTERSDKRQPNIQLIQKSCETSCLYVHSVSCVTMPGKVLCCLSASNSKAWCLISVPRSLFFLLLSFGTMSGHW